MRSRLALAASIVALPVSLTAQSTVLGESVPKHPVPPPPAVVGPQVGPTALPASLANAFGNSNNNIPFSWSPTQYQQVFDGTEIASSYVMTALAMRQDDQFSGFTGRTVDLEINLGATTLTVATLSNTFATNFNVGAPTNVLPRQNIALPNMPPTLPTNPAVFFMQIPFANPFPWPATAGQNLLIQVTNRGNSNGNAIFTYPMDAGSGINTTRLYGFPDTALTGTLGVNYGHVMSFLPAGSIAAVELSGNGCMSGAVSFYELYDSTHGPFDMSNTSLQLIPTGTGYTVLSGNATFTPPTSAHLGLTDDSNSAPQALPFSLAFPGGSTSTIVICSNGYIVLGSTAPAADYTPTVNEMLTLGPRLLPFWNDHLPNSTNNVHFDVDTTNNRVLVTWNGVPEYGGAGVCTMQVVFNASGIIDIIYQGVTHPGHATTPITGFSPGANNRNPGNRDISATLPFVTSTDQAGLTQNATRPVMGQVCNLQVTNIPASSLAGLELIGLAVPGFDLTPIGAPTCFLYVTPIFVTIAFSGTPSATIPLPIPNSPSVDGVRVPVQALSVAPGTNAAGIVLSNLATLVIGVN